jgi:hypothetical protein
MDGERRIVSFRRAKRSQPLRTGPVKDLARYEQGSEDVDTYRHRMIVNALAFLFVIGLITAGIWLAETMADLRRGQDCVLLGRHGCAPIEQSGGRW